MKKSIHAFLSIFSLSFLLYATGCNKTKATEVTNETKIKETATSTAISTDVRKFNTADYDRKLKALSNSDTTGKWPAKTPYPLPGALLPYNRIIAFYGNFYSKRMGVLGELPRDKMLVKLQTEIVKWQKADPFVPTIPALHYIAISAQSLPGKSNKYRMRMPFHQIDTVLKWAEPIHALVILDVQVGQSTVTEEVATLEKYLKLPNVHLGIDPEFSMKDGSIPRTKIGTFTSADINDAIDILSNIVRKYKLPPKVLIVHRFTQAMITDYKKIKTVPEVQVVINMDGFGGKALKRSTYRACIFREPVQFAGFKLFYKNDTKNNITMYTPEEILKLTPIPIYIQYQ